MGLPFGCQHIFKTGGGAIYSRNHAEFSICHQLYVCLLWLGTKWLQWRHNLRDDVSNNRRLDGLLNRLLKRRDQRNYQKSASLAFVREIQRWQLNSPNKEPVTRKMFPFGDVIMSSKVPHPTIELTLRNVGNVWSMYITDNLHNPGCNVIPTAKNKIAHMIMFHKWNRLI